jgi:hypothetical protein
VFRVFYLLRLALPPFLPAIRASSLFHSCALPVIWETIPPILAILRCFSRLIVANPRRGFSGIKFEYFITVSVQRCGERV